VHVDTVLPVCLSIYKVTNILFLCLTTQHISDFDMKWWYGGKRRHS